MVIDAKRVKAREFDNLAMFSKAAALLNTANRSASNSIEVMFVVR